MSFRYDGGDCENSNNIQDAQIFQCEDYFGGPPDVNEIGAESFIVATDIKGLGINYFTGIVPVGGEFNTTNPIDGALVGSNMNVTIYEGEAGRQIIRQTMLIHTSCSQVTFLKDRYGALLLIAFENAPQGFVDSFYDIKFRYSVSSVSNTTTTLDTMTSTAAGFAPPQPGILNFTGAVSGAVLSPGQNLTLMETEAFEIDISEGIQYTFLTNITGNNDGFECSVTVKNSFRIGLIESRYPSATPSAAPVP
jgi:hypothetical protein